MSRPDPFRNSFSPYDLPASAFHARDRRIDVLRGLAVLGISANHIWPEGSYGTQYAAYKFGHLFAFDFADVFVLLSGIVAGILYFPLLLRSGAKACFTKSVARAGQIWRVQILCVCVSLTIILFFERFLGVHGSNLSPFDAPTLAAFAGNIFLYSPSVFLDILPVYIMLLALLPLALIVFRRSVLLYFALTGAAWAAIWIPVFLASAKLSAIPTETFRSSYFIHPLSAQLLFFAGVAIGARKRAIETFLGTYRRQMLFCAAAFLVTTNYMHQVTWMVHHFDQKHFTGPLRLAELLAVIIVIWCLVDARSFKSPHPGLVETCGRNILPVFAITTVGAVFFTYMVNWLSAERLIYGLCIAANVSLCLTAGYLLEKHKTSGKKAPRENPVKPTVLELHTT